MTDAVNYRDDAFLRIIIKGNSKSSTILQPQFTNLKFSLSALATKTILKILQFHTSPINNHPPYFTVFSM